MKDKRLFDMIGERLERHQSELAERQRETDGSMQELMARREAFAAAARRIVEGTLEPAVEQLRRHFDNAVMIEPQVEDDFRTVCRFEHTPRFPATVSLTFSLVPAKDYLSMIARCSLDVFPTLMEYRRSDEISCELENADQEVVLWVQEQILRFVDTYLLLETHPLYQRDNMVTDPVCGMRISFATAGSTLELGGRVFYFCSDVCRDEFQRKVAAAKG